MDMIRPSRLRTLGLIHMVVALLALPSETCCGIGQMIYARDFLAVGGPLPPRQRDQADRFLAYRAARLPEYPPAVAGEALANPFLAALLLLAGWGLWRGRDWGRRLSILYAVLAVANGGLVLFYTLLRFRPAVDQFFAADPARLAPDAALEATLRFEIGALLVIQVLAVAYALFAGSVALASRPHPEPEPHEA